jgi:hypothetical protein
MRGRMRKATTFWSILAAALLVAHGRVALGVSATPDQYDPRQDPDVAPKTSERGPGEWEAIWGLVREFEGRSYPSEGANQVPGQVAVPQPWHYVQGAPSFVGSPPILDAPVYEGVYGGAYYGAESFFPGWWGVSTRIPWWSLIPPSGHHRHRHHRDYGGRGDDHHW